MKKKTFLLWLAFVFALVLVMPPVTGYATESVSVATLEELQTQIDKGMTAITLTNGITITERVVDLSPSKPVTITTEVTDVFTVVGNGKLTLGENLTINGTSSILWAKDGGEICINGAKITKSSEQYNVVFVEANSKLIVVDGSIEQTTGDRNTIDTTPNATVEIQGGTISAAEGSVIRADGANVTISGGKIKTATNKVAAVYSMNNGTINVTGGELSNGTGESCTLIAAAGGKVNMSGGSVNNGVLAHESADAEATISDTAVVSGSVGAKDGATLTITAGIFTSNPSEYVDKENYVVNYKTEDKVYEVVEKEELEEGTSEDNTLQIPDLDSEIDEIMQEEANTLEKQFKSDYEDVDANSITVKQETSLKVEAVEQDPEEETYKVDIKAFAQIVVSSGEKELRGEKKDYDTAGKKVIVTVTIPQEASIDLTQKYVYVRHFKEGSSEPVGVYPVTVDDRKVTFYNKDGFSTFEFYSQDTINLEAYDILHNLTLKSEIDFSFAVPVSAFPDGISGLKATITQKHALEHKTAEIVGDWDKEKIDGEGYYRFRYTGVAPAEIADELVLTIKDENGNPIIEDISSVVAYATEQISKDSTPKSFKNLMKALLQYGAKAQTYFGYTGTQITATPFNLEYNNVTGPESTLWHNLTLKSQINLSFLVEKTDELATSYDGFTATITGDFNGVKNNSKEITNWETVEHEGSKYWRLRCEWIAPAELENKVKLTVIKQGETGVTVEDTYSVAAYADKMINANTTDSNLKELLKALRIYGKAAEAYFPTISNN